MKISKKWFLLAGLGLIVPALALVGCQAAPTSPASIDTVYLSSQQTGISVSGEGRTTAVPDLATLQVGVQSQQPTVTAARDEAAQAMTQVIAALENSGVAEGDIQTQYFNISQVTQWNDRDNQQEVIGYQVTNTVTAKIRDINSVGQVIDAVAAGGGDLIRINGVSFTVEDPTPYVAQIRELAMNDARNKAEQLAELAGVTLGAPVYISESSQLPSPIYRGVNEAAVPTSVVTPISPGETEITLNVQVTYAIAN